jgi:hypothetical protein
MAPDYLKRKLAFKFQCAVIPHGKEYYAASKNV